MPIASIRLRPGADTELTPTYDQAAYDEVESGRFRAGVFEKLGGWTKFYPLVINGNPRALHAWQDLNQNKHLGAATTTVLNVITEGVLRDITPKEVLSENDPIIESTISDATIEITDDNISNVTDYDSVEFLTPISIGNIILSGVYPIATRTGTTSYTIEARANATATRASASITGITQANPAVVTYSGDDNWANGDLVYIYGVAGMTEVNGNLYEIDNVDTGANTFELSGINSTGFGMYTSGGTASPAAVPEFQTTTDSSIVTVRLQSHAQAVGNTVVFPEATTVGGLTIQGKYTVLSVTSVDLFTIAATQAASSTAATMMNAGEMSLRYYITLTPGVAGVGYGLGPYGEGAYGIGEAGGTDQNGTKIVATNYALDNWGELLIANIENEGIYYWGPTEGLSNAKLIENAPTKSRGMFVSQAAQQIISYGSSINAWDPVSQASGIAGIGVYQDPLLVKWCDIGDFTVWSADSINQAREFRIPNGSECIGGCAPKNRNLVWTDLELYAFTYTNLPDVYSPNKVGENCGLIGKHAFARYGDAVYWMGLRNFFVYAGAGVQTIPCSVWSYVFQDLDEINQHLCVGGSNGDSTEVWFFFPSISGGNGYPDKYVKYNIVEGVWDKGIVPQRSAWIDRSVLGNPIAFGPTGIIYSHEDGYNDDEDPLLPSFRTSWFSISESQQFVTIDQIIPDFKWGLEGGSQNAQISLTVYSVETPGETPRMNGPYLVTQESQYVTLDPPIRDKLFALEVSSSDTDSFWRTGLIRFRYAPDGRV